MSILLQRGLCMCCMSVLITGEPAKTAEPIETPLAGRPACQRNQVLDGTSTLWAAHFGNKIKQSALGGDAGCC